MTDRRGPSGDEDPARFSKGRVVPDLRTAGEGRGDAPALVGTEEGWSYRRLEVEVGERVEALRPSVSSGEAIPIVVEPDAESVLSLLALWYCGAVPVPLNPKLTDRERAVATAAVRAAHTHLPPDAHSVVWTSGTGGVPRGVVLTTANMEAMIDGARDRLSLDATDVWLASLSPAHVGGLALVTRALALGGTVLAPGRFDVEVVSDWLDGEDLPPGAPSPPTRLSLVPTQLLRLLDHRRGRGAPEGLRSVLVGGAHAPEELVARARRAGWPIALTYGATEMSSQIATAPPELVARKPGTVGTPLAGVELRIAPDGEILTRGVGLAAGYVRGGASGREPPEAGGGAASEPSTSGLAPLTGPDGWYHTGDLGRMDEDGHLRVTGRRDDRIVTGGVTVDALEVEEGLRSHPSVLDACVVGLPDPEWGEIVGAWVVAVAGEFDPDEVTEHLAGLLGAPKLPRRWHAGGALPLNANGKVDRVEVRAVLEASLRRTSG